MGTMTTAYLIEQQHGGGTRLLVSRTPKVPGIVRGPVEISAEKHLHAGALEEFGRGHVVFTPQDQSYPSLLAMLDD